MLDRADTVNILLLLLASPFVFSLMLYGNGFNCLSEYFANAVLTPSAKIIYKKSLLALAHITVIIRTTPYIFSFLSSAPVFIITLSQISRKKMDKFELSILKKKPFKNFA